MREEWRLEKEHSHQTHSLIRCIVLIRIGLDWVGLGWAGVEYGRTSCPSSVRSTTGAKEIIDRWAMLPHAFQGSVVTQS